MIGLLISKICDELLIVMNSINTLRVSLISLMSNMQRKVEDLNSLLESHSDISAVKIVLQ